MEDRPLIVGDVARLALTNPNVPGGEVVQVSSTRALVAFYGGMGKPRWEPQTNLVRQPNMTEVEARIRVMCAEFTANRAPIEEAS